MDIIQSSHHLYLEAKKCALQKLNQKTNIPGVQICILFIWGIIIGEKFEDTKGVIRSHTSENDTQYNGQKKILVQNLQNTTQ